jgi:hypothetical protein
MIDILPRIAPHELALRFNGFLYGYNFLKSLENLNNNFISKNINFSIYPGNAATDEYKNYLISLLPKGSNYAMLCGKNSYVQNNDEKHPVYNNYAEVLLSSKIIISHFGVTLYEGFISKCRSITINPTQYHSKLSDILKEKIDLINLGELKDLNIIDAAKTIEKVLLMPDITERINAEEVYKIILNDLEEFYKLVISC